MKKKGIAVIAAACALCVALFVAGCGGSGSSSASGSAAGSSSVVGHWTNMSEELLAESEQEMDLEALEDEEAAAEEELDAEAEQAESENAEAEAEAESDAADESEAEAEAESEAEADTETKFPLVSTFVVLNEDGTAQVAVAGVSEDGTWEGSGNSATITIPSTNPIKVTVTGDTMKLEEDSLTINLKKTEAANPFDYGDMNLEEMMVEPELSDIDPVVIADDDKVTLTVTGKGTDYTGDPGYRMTLVNKTQGTIGLDVEDVFTVSGAEVGAQAGVTNADAEFSVEPGATSDAMFLYFPADELEGGIEKLVDVTGKISVYDEEQDDYIATYDFKM